MNKRKLNIYTAINLVESKYVHKKNPENILLSNLRRALPTHIPKSVWNREVELSDVKLTKDEMKMLRSYYILHTETDFSFLKNEPTDKKIEEEYYVLLNVPHFLDTDLLEEKKYFSIKEIDELKKYYSLNERKRCYVINKSVRDVEEIQILRILQRKDICMSEDEKYSLSLIMEKLPGIQKENIFYANMVININHPYYFEHSTDHVPGMMIMEAARQLIISQLHIHNNMPLSVSMILNSFNATFKNYLELNHPIRLKGVITKMEINVRENYPAFCEMDIFVLQRDAIAAKIAISGQAISKRLFTKLRRRLPKESERARYYPNESFYNHVTIRQEDMDLNIRIKLINLSLDGFCVEMNEPILLKEGIPLFDILVCFEDVGFSLGKCRIVWQIGENSKYYAGIEIVNMNQKDRDNLYEAIKRYCYVIEEREIL